LSVGFSADGSSVRSLTGESDANGTQAAIAERSLVVATMIAEVCRQVKNGALGDAEWTRYLPGVTYRRTCDAVRR
jgi:hypothetical protein